VAESRIPASPIYMPYLSSKSPELLRHDFKNLSSPRQLAALLEVEYSRLIYHIHKVPPDKRYTVFSIPKKSGGLRQITAPISPLKMIQRRLNVVLSTVIEPKHSAHGFVRGRNIRTNSKVHAGRQYIFTIDLADFFPSINFGRVRGVFMAPPFNLNSQVATVLAQICIFNNILPQGAPTSPTVSNLICRKMDQQLGRLARKYKCNYTRYGDDITFSTNKEVFPSAIAVTVADTNETLAGEELRNVVRANGFSINAKKVRLLYRCHRQTVTGLVSNKFPNVDRRYIRRIRAMLHAARKFGFDAAQAHFHARYYNKHRNLAAGPPSFRKVLRGRIDFVGMVRGHLDPLFLSLIRQLQTLDPSLVPKLPSPTWFEEIKSAMFVIDVTIAEEMKQGTGFALKGTGLVTCAHVIEGSPSKIEIYQGHFPSKKYYADVIFFDSSLDTAVLKIRDFEGRELMRGDDGAVRDDSEIILAGYPHYAPGNSGTIARGRIVGNYVYMGHRRFLIDCTIAPGNSGGPVLDSRRRVIGIAAKGDPNSVIPISAIK
jgi:RNA-directed DNA polymerase